MITPNITPISSESINLFLLKYKAKFFNDLLKRFNILLKSKTRYSAGRRAKKDHHIGLVNCPCSDAIIAKGVQSKGKSIILIDIEKETRIITNQAKPSLMSIFK